MMNPCKFLPSILLLLAVSLAAQQPEPAPRHEQGEIKLPNGKNQKDEILKADFEKNVADAQKLVELSKELEKTLEANTRFVLSIEDLKRLDEIEKTAKRIRSRLKRY